MIVIEGDNVNTIFPRALDLLRRSGIQRVSRGGLVYEYPEPVCLVYSNPMQRVLFDPYRDANPFFHLVEAIWMLDGRNDVKSVGHYNKKMFEFSDDGIRLEGAYGYRWRYYYSYDQLVHVISSLKCDPNDRRCVVTMWDGYSDLNRGGFDIPCNTHIYFKIKRGKLDMTVCCRSNDLIWGACGANVVHMSMLHEYMAFKIGVKIGVYRQISDSLHFYVEVHDKFDSKMGSDTWDPYEQSVRAEPVFDDRWLYDAHMFMNENWKELDWSQNPFWRELVIPARLAWNCYKEDNLYDAMIYLEKITGFTDWAIAMTSWMQRRIDRRA